MSVLANIAILAGIIIILSELIPAIHVKNIWTAFVVAIVYSVINFLVGWFLVLMSFPLMFLTFGLFKLVINAFLLWITDKLIDEFEIKNFGWTFITAVIIAVASTAIHAIL